MGDSARRQRGVCRHHGRRPGSLSATARSAAPARVPRRNLEAADYRHARAGPRQTWNVLASQCLDRRIADKQILAHEVTAWQDHRNKHHAKADWQFTTANARVKLKRLY